MWNLKICSQLVNITKKKQTHRHREEAGGFQWGTGGGEEAIWMDEEWEVQTIGCTIGSRRYCTIWEMK